jgi:hypothetical protein
MEDVSVICAVWHKDEARHDLARAHVANLKAQTVPVRPIYVFDGGDVPPSWLEAETITAKSPLTIYQAWNLALAAVRTPLVMNLNLDDRLAPDAVEKLTAGLEATQSVLIGGDWRICYSQSDTDHVARCYAAADTPFMPNWPPVQGSDTRLGSGTGERLTYGPATLWKFSVHGRIPRYPWRFRDGALIRTVGDTAFWTALSQLGGKLARLPMVIGNYHSHPEGQAEFRGEDELPRLLSNTVELI